MAELRTVSKTYRICDEVIHKPSNTDTSKARPIALENKPVRRFSTDYGVFLETSWLLHLQSPNKDGHSRDKPKTERHAPNSTEMVFTEASGDKVIQRLV